MASHSEFPTVQKHQVAPQNGDHGSANGHQNSHSSSNFVHLVNPDSISFSEKIGGRMTISCDQTKLAIQKAAQAIISEELVAFPTETVYGLGASATSTAAVSKIFKTKGRPSDNPLIIHVSSLDILKGFVLCSDPSPNPNSPPIEEWQFPLIYKVLIDAFWPGPLTILLPIQAKCAVSEDGSRLSPISDLVTCGLSTVAVRMPAHPVARALLTEAGLPIAAPSANLSGCPSPTTAQHVQSDFQTKIPTILDGGSCLVGVESTVVDGLNPDGRLRILRLGGLSPEAIQSCLSKAGLDHLNGQPTVVGVYNQDYVDHSLDLKPTTPGMKYKHYSPRAKVIVLDPISSNQLSTHPQPQSTPNVNQFVSQLYSDFHLNHPTLVSPNKDKDDDVEGNKVLKIGLMMIEDSLLAQEFERCASSLIPQSDPEANSMMTAIQNKNKFTVRFTNSNLGRVDQPELSARRLFGSLRYLDESIGVDWILVERLPETGLGKTVMERLRKASGHSAPASVLLSSRSP